MAISYNKSIGHLVQQLFEYSVPLTQQKTKQCMKVYILLILSSIGSALVRPNHSLYFILLTQHYYKRHRYS